jgi:hypothetical protein
MNPTTASAIKQPQFIDFMKMPSPLPCACGVTIVREAIGAPQFGQAEALSET